jgi:hypothetical protein
MHCARVLPAMPPSSLFPRDLCQRRRRRVPGQPCPPDPDPPCPVPSMLTGTLTLTTHTQVMLPRLKKSSRDLKSRLENGFDSTRLDSVGPSQLKSTQVDSRVYFYSKEFLGFQLHLQRFHEKSRKHDRRHPGVTRSDHGQSKFKKLLFLCCKRPRTPLGNSGHQVDLKSLESTWKST